MSRINTNRFASRNPTSSYGSADISGSAAVHQGNNDITVDNRSTIHTNTLVQQFCLPFEVLSQGTYDAFHRQQQRRRPPLNTSHVQTHEARRGRARSRGGTDTSRCGSQHDSYNIPPSTSPSSVSASRSPSSTRFQRRSFSHSRRRRSSLSRHSDVSTPISATASSATSVFSVQEREKRLLDCIEEQLSPKKLPSPDLNKPLPWTGHILNPHDKDHQTSQINSGISMGNNAPPPTDDEPLPPDRRRWADLSVPELCRLVRLALDEVEGRYARDDGYKEGCRT